MEMIARQSVLVDPLKQQSTIAEKKTVSADTSLAASFVFVESPSACFLEATDVLLAKGEVKQAVINKVEFNGHQCVLLVSQFRLLLVSRNEAVQHSIPLCSILDIKSDNGKSTAFDVKTKDCRFFQIALSAKCSLLKLLHSLVFQVSPLNFFPLDLVKQGIHCVHPSPLSLQAELARWNPTSTQYKIFDQTSLYSLCPTYPRLLIVPSVSTFATLEGASRFRDKARLPVLSWASHAAGSIWRSAQPKASLINRSTDDEELLKQARVMLIVDCRPMLNAYANIANGAGVESLTNYHSGIELVFAGIHNIHHVRDAWENMFCASQKFFTLSSGPWFSQLEATGWYDHLTSILRAAHLVVEKVKSGTNVLCRCSHGLDRTPQVVSLAMLALDPYYRTFKGFAVLVEKDWVSMGHRFHTRNCLGQTPNDEFSPIFTQWTESVFQLLATHPDSFEFKSSFLLAVLHAMLSGRFGNFLFDSERERIQHALLTPEGAVVEDVWTHLLAEKIGHTNHNFAHRHIQTADSVLEIDIRVSQIKVWNELWFSLKRNPRVYSE